MSQAPGSESALPTPHPGGRRRRHPRIESGQEGKMKVAGDETSYAILGISGGGAKVDIQTGAPVKAEEGKQVDLFLDGHPIPLHATILHRDAGRLVVELADITIDRLRALTDTLPRLDHSFQDLSNRNLDHAAFRFANLVQVNMSGSKLIQASMAGADLRDASLRGANLDRADLGGAFMNHADLKGANLAGANLRGAHLVRARLSGADLRGADLTGADLRGAVLDDAQLPDFRIFPDSGRFTAWKAVVGFLAEIEVPDGARRTGCLVDNGGRAEAVRVLNLFTQDGRPAPPNTVAHSKFDRETVYRVGQVTEARSYNHDIRLSCVGGIHFVADPVRARRHL